MHQSACLPEIGEPRSRRAQGPRQHIDADKKRKVPIEVQSVRGRKRAQNSRSWKDEKKSNQHKRQTHTHTQKKKKTPRAQQLSALRSLTMGRGPCPPNGGGPPNP